MDILSLSHISKRFGRLPVIKDLSFSVPEHSVFGFIGKNGSGKTTTMKMILGFLSMDGGEIKVCGEKVVYGSSKTNRFIGYLPDVPQFYPYMTPKEYLALCGKVAGLSAERTAKRSQELLTLVGLDGIDRRIRGFSRGMNQRLGIAQALLSEPKLLICDEPTSALDPIGRKEILDILAVAKTSTTILFSTHILSDVERVCDNIGVLDEGVLKLEGNLNDIKNSYRQDTALISLADPGRNQELMEGLSQLSIIKGCTEKERDVVVRFTGTEAARRQILELLLSRNLPLVRFELLEPTLENLFLEVVQ
ncbi:ABC transporter ATP-binding protein [Zongyangia hominis]|uniref:ABC transporter ATP-binding protein n=1 Tax=Zongyangia hominis TaxID=2763677 RepID=A0A926I5Y3_9FIRM|nr:ABC transporter ATP-binding protein [Zongyangia hominis]MBC8569399.1 ABC transporter ATP-binding protein [Zongyangia hominis]